MAVDKSKAHLTAITHLDDELVETINVKKFLAEVAGVKYGLSSYYANKPMPQRE